MSKNKFFGNVGKEEVDSVEEAEVVSIDLPSTEALDVALRDANLEELGLSMMDEANEEVILEATAIKDYPFSAVSYYRDNTTGHYHLVDIGYDPVSGEVGLLNVDPDRTALDRNSIEEEFKISVVNNVFNR